MTDKTHNIDMDNLPMHRYITMLHLIAVKKSNFIELRDLLCIKMESGFPIAYLAKSLLGGIIEVIEDISKKWDEDIPIPNAFVFDRNGEFTSHICEYVFNDRDNQPDEQAADDYFERVISYPRWEDVLEVFRNLAFE